jgi:uncharacterized protein (TIGR00106 family)
MLPEIPGDEAFVSCLIPSIRVNCKKIQEARMLTNFSIIPIGVGEELKIHIAEIIKIVDQSGLDYKLGAMQTTVEGNSDEVISLIMKCHNHMKTMAPRVLTSITIDDRKGAHGRIRDKIQDVEDVLGKELEHE